MDQVRTGEVILGEAGRGVVSGGTSSAPTEARIETPYLQLVMTRLWDEEMRAGSHTLRLEKLNSLGGAEHIVRTHLDSVVSTLPADAQDRAARVFHYLVTPGGSKIAHTVSDLAEYTGLATEQVASVLEELSRQDIRILRPVRPPDQQAPLHYEIFHDVLAPAILDWRARYVKAQDLAEAEKQAAMEAAEQEKEAALHRELAQERRRVRWLKLGLTVLVLLLIVMVGLAIYAFLQRFAAQKATVEAEQQARLATARQVAAQAQSRYVRLDLALLLSLEANRIADTVEGKGSLLDALRRSPHLTTFLTGHTRSVQSVAFSPDGTALASGSDDKTTILWDVSFESWQARACRIANRNLTRAEWKEYIGDIEPYRATCPGLPVEQEVPAEK